uniref:EF-hand domain-containing protein n=1 Tax=Meleagris gallopavo TaxID=9103 RepID=A0A803XTK1_MELGA
MPHEEAYSINQIYSINKNFLTQDPQLWQFIPFSPSLSLQQKQDSFSLDNVIKLLDKNNDGSISFDEFVMLIKKITGQ